MYSPESLLPYDDLVQNEKYLRNETTNNENPEENRINLFVQKITIPELGIIKTPFRSVQRRHRNLLFPVVCVENIDVRQYSFKPSPVELPYRTIGFSSLHYPVNSSLIQAVEVFDKEKGKSSKPKKIRRYKKPICKSRVNKTNAGAQAVIEKNSRKLHLLLDEFNQERLKDCDDSEIEVIIHKLKEILNYIEPGAVSNTDLQIPMVAENQSNNENPTSIYTYNNIYLQDASSQTGDPKNQVSCTLMAKGQTVIDEYYADFSFNIDDEDASNSDTHMIKGNITTLIQGRMMRGKNKKPDPKLSEPPPQTIEEARRRKQRAHMSLCQFIKMERQNQTHNLNAVDLSCKTNNPDEPSTSQNAQNMQNKDNSSHVSIEEIHKLSVDNTIYKLKSERVMPTFSKIIELLNDRFQTIEQDDNYVVQMLLRAKK